MAVNSPQKAPYLRKSLLIGTGVILQVLAIALIFQLISRFAYQQGISAYNKNDLSDAEVHLQKARAYGILNLPADRKRLALLAGDIALDKSYMSAISTENYNYAEASKKEYGLAVSIDPLNVHGYTGLALALARLEKLFLEFQKQPYPEKALPVFKKLLTIMPVRLYSYEILSDYYASRNMGPEFEDLIFQYLALKPSFYFKLKNEKYYRHDMDSRAENALKEAGKVVTLHATAMRGLADIAAENGNVTQAISYYLEAKPRFEYANNANYYIELGGLYVKAKKYEEAKNAFCLALQNDHGDRKLDWIFSIYRNNAILEEFVVFARIIEKIFPVRNKLRLLVGESYLMLEQYDLALKEAGRIKSLRYEAQAKYLMARIAEKMKNWDAMELDAQKASVLDSSNYRYFVLLARALERQGKLKKALKSYNSAIGLTKKDNPWVYHSRGWLFWRLKDFQNAGQDFHEALHIAPRKAVFYYNLTIYYQNQGDLSKAFEMIKNAIKIEPKNQKYQEVFEKIKRS